MSIRIIGKAKDIRTGTFVVYVQANISTYLNLIGDDFDEFEIQRRRVQHKAYSRMRSDIVSGTLLPAITLSVKKDYIETFLNKINNDQELLKVMNAPGRVNILDGLQRTHILADIKKDGHIFDDGQTILLEYWLEGNVNNLIYRIIVLNSGQKPMSMRHQIELLFSTTKENLRESIPDIEIFTERDEARRTRAGKYALERLAISYYAFIMKSTEIDKENIIAQKIIEDSILEEGEEELGKKFSKFTGYLQKFYLMDKEIFRLYDAEACAWLGSENFMISFFAAISNFSIDEKRERRISEALDKLIADLGVANIGDDIFGYLNYKQAIVGLPSRRTNVGYATRKLLSTVFKEFFREAGEKSLSELWAVESI